jgi:hypothetical protein
MNLYEFSRSLEKSQLSNKTNPSGMSVSNYMANVSFSFAVAWDISDSSTPTLEDVLLRLGEDAMIADQPGLLEKVRRLLYSSYLYHEHLPLDMKITIATRHIAKVDGKLYLRYVCIRGGKIKFMKEKLGKFLSRHFSPKTVSLLTDAIGKQFTIQLKVYIGNKIYQLYDPGEIAYNTCMRHYPEAIALYANNPDVVRCIGGHDGHKFVFKALIWKGDDDIWYIDNSYYSDGSVSALVSAMLNNNDCIEGHRISREKNKLIIHRLKISDSIPYMDHYSRLLYMDYSKNEMYVSNTDHDSNYVSVYSDILNEIKVANEDTIWSNVFDSLSYTIKHEDTISSYYLWENYRENVIQMSLPTFAYAMIKLKAKMGDSISILCLDYFQELVREPSSCPITIGDMA